MDDEIRDCVRGCAMLRVWALRTSPSKGFSVDFVSEPSMMDHSCGARAPAGLCTGRALAFFAEALCAEGFCAEGFCAEVGTLPTGCFGLAVLVEKSAPRMERRPEAERGACGVAISIVVDDFQTYRGSSAICESPLVDGEHHRPPPLPRLLFSLVRPWRNPSRSRASQRTRTRAASQKSLPTPHSQLFPVCWRKRPVSA